MTKNPNFSLRVLHVSPEYAPLAQKGGLGDVAAALPKALRRNGIDARVLVPAWPGVLDYASEHGFLQDRPIGQISAAIDWRAWTAKLWEADINGTPVYILDQPDLFSDPNIYPEKMEAEDARPFIFHTYAALELAEAVKWKPQFLHAHDWPTATLPSALRWHRYYSKFSADYDAIFTIHNMAHQGIFDASGLEGWGFSPSSFSMLNPDTLEFYGQANLMKGALISADAISTVSPSYSWEIQSASGGFGLDGVIVAQKNKLRGIINGIDYDVWNPATDNHLIKNYSAEKMNGKKACREDLIARCGWQDDGRPIAAFIGRLAEQKGVEVMLSALDVLLENEVRAVIIGSGTDYYNRKLTDFAKRHCGRVQIIIGFNEEAAHRTYAGADILLMPSLFEPCGLSQLIAFAYGTIPVARATGGLSDTVFDADESLDGTGFLFTEYTSEELIKAVRRALSAKADTPRWHRIMTNAMKSDFSWGSSAKEYIELYKSVLHS